MKINFKKIFQFGVTGYTFCLKTSIKTRGVNIWCNLGGYTRLHLGYTGLHYDLLTNFNKLNKIKRLS